MVNILILFIVCIIFILNDNMRNDITTRKSEIEKWISENRTKNWIATQLVCKIDTLNSYLKKWNIIYVGNQGEKGYKKSKVRKTAIEYLKSDKHISNPILRKKLIEDGIKKDECEDCGTSEWMGKKIVLELHHIDCNHYNNNLSNLKILCPNCHSLIPNHYKKTPV